MKLIFTIIIFQLFLSCNSADNHLLTNVQTDTSKANYGKALLDKDFSIDPTKILKDFTTWYNYTYYNVRLSQDFIGLNIDSVEIDKTTFLSKLMIENVVAFKIKLLQGKPVYKLYKLNSNDESIESTIKQLASIEMTNLKMEGKQIFPFNFTALNGKIYNRYSTKGKIIILKCWFIHCTACVREFPECNELVDEYQGKNYILFISLASDTKNELERFLKTKEFKYAVIPDMDNYMTTKLNINQYPTHFLIDTTGKIVKVVNSIEELKPFLKKEAEKHV